MSFPNFEKPYVFLFRNSFVKIDNPIEERTINEMEANTSNLTNAELTYTPAIPKISANAIMSFFGKYSIFDIFLDKINQIPIPEKIIKTEWNRNDCDKVVVACSETESVNGFVVVKNGLIAFR